MRSKYLVTILVLLAVLLALTLLASPARAGGQVSVCDQDHLLAALAGGGTVTFACSGTIGLTSPVKINTNTTIDGSGQWVAISGMDAVKVFDVGFGITLSINELTIDYGNNMLGGGIYVNYTGILILSNSTLRDNSGGIGGGIYNDGGTVSVSNSTFYQNGEGIYIQSGSLTVSNSTFYDNYGSGIYINGGTVTVSNSIFSNNSSNYYRGGAIYNDGTLNVTNSTFSGNSATKGGGIYNGGGTLTVTNNTFSGNSATEGGGGIYNDYGTVTLRNTIIASSTGGNCAGTITNSGGNLSYPDTTCPGINRDPILGPLQDNGGPTYTMALRPGSPAIDAGTEPCPATDQRGVHRPIDGNIDGNAICDIGSFEYQPPTIFLPMVFR